MADNPDQTQSRKGRKKHPKEEKGHSKDDNTPKGKTKDKTKDVSLDIAIEPETRNDHTPDGTMRKRLMRVALVVLAGVKVIFSRLLFIFHTLLTVWRTADVLGPRYWFLLLGLVALIVEAVLKLVTKKGVESKWFCPSVFLYLCTVVPAIWLLELDRLSSRQSVGTNVTTQTNNSNNVNNNQTSTGLSSIEGIEIPITLSRDMWVLAIEQTLLFLLIIGRWMLPKGNITRDQLSQLLFVYIGIASDISEIFVLFEEQFVIDRPSLIYIILTAWTLSLMQYTLVLTATKSRKTRVAHAQDGDVEAAGREEKGGLFAWLCCACCETETWAILTTILLQDGPFLCIRLYVMIASMSLTYTILFYTFKNMLVLVLQIYRLVVINCDPSKGDEDGAASENHKSPSPSPPKPVGGPSKDKAPKKLHEKDSLQNASKDQDGKNNGSRDRRKSRAPKKTGE